MKIIASYIDEADLEKRVEWINDNRINSTMYFELPITLEGTKKWFSNRNLNSRVDFIFKSGREIIGMGGFTNLSKQNKNAEFYVMVNPDMHGKGIGSKISYWMYNYAFLKLKLHKIFLYTNDDNEKAYRLYENAGFKLEGILREHKLKKGELANRRFYGLLKTEWNLQKWKKEKISYEF